MRAATQLNGGAVAHHAYLFAVFFAEQGHGSHGPGLVDGHVAVLVESYGHAHFLVGKMFDLAEFFGCDFLEV